MTTNKTNIVELQRLTQFFNIDKVVSLKDIEAVLDGVLAIMNKFKLDNEALTEETKERVNDLYNRITTEHAQALTEMTSRSQEVKAEVVAKVDRSLQEMKELCADLLMHKPQDGKDADEDLIIEKVLSKIEIPEYKEPVLDDAEQIRAKLETLTEDNRLDASAIKNLPEAGEGKSWRSSVTEAPLDGLTYGRRNMEWVVISTTGSGFTILTATGAIDDSNKDFTFTEKPTIIVINGATYRENNGWSWNAGTLTATLDNPVGTGGDIYGLS